MYIYKISQQYIDVARAEIETIIGKTTTLSENLLLVDEYTDKTQRLAYTKNVYEILAQGKKLDDVLQVRIEDEYRVDAVGCETLPIAEKLFALYGKKVSLEEYEHHYVVFCIDGEYYFTESMYVNGDTGQERRAHQREHNHPTSMHPLLAKAMVNLSGKTSFIDPFCGAGGILIEGALLGHEVLGADISSEMIERAQENLDALGLVAQLAVQNALLIEHTYDAVVTDLPYGKNSILESVDLYDAFLENAKNITDIMVVGCKEGSITDLHGWKLKHKFSIYAHKSLTREILVLKK